MEVRVREPLGLTQAVNPRGKGQLASRRTDAAMSGAVAAIGMASWWGNGEEQGVKKRQSAAGNRAAPLSEVTGLFDAATWAAVPTPLPLFFFLVLTGAGAAALA